MHIRNDRPVDSVETEYEMYDQSESVRSRSHPAGVDGHDWILVDEGGGQSRETVTFERADASRVRNLTNHNSHGNFVGMLEGTTETDGDLGSVDTGSQYQESKNLDSQLRGICVSFDRGEETQSGRRRGSSSVGPTSGEPECLSTTHSSRHFVFLPRWRTHMAVANRQSAVWSLTPCGARQIRSRQCSHAAVVRSRAPLRDSREGGALASAVASIDIMEHNTDSMRAHSRAPIDTCTYTRIYLGSSPFGIVLTRSISWIVRGPQ